MRFEARWQIGLGMIAIVFYCVQIITSIKTQGLLVNNNGMDFRAFWSAGIIASTFGYKEVYNLELMEEIQANIIHLSASISPFEVAPVSILPVFFPVLQLVALFPPITSFLLCTSINFFSTFFYTLFLFNSFKIPKSGLLALMGLLSFPSFLNIYWGQINLPLMICVGEFIRNLYKKRELEVGLWLGGLILKPQLLILIGPVLFFQRKWRLLSGFLLTIILMLLASLILGKLEGMLAFVDTILKFSTGLPTNAPGNMMNWRMIGERLDMFLPTQISWVIASTGMVTTLIMVFLLWRRQVKTDTNTFIIAFTGTMTGTLAVTWHSHPAMAMILIPLLIYIFCRNQLLAPLFYSWFLGLPIIMLILTTVIFTSGLTKYNLVAAIPGLFMLIFNLIFLGWAWKYIRSHAEVFVSRDNF